MSRQLHGRRAKHWDFILLDTVSLQFAFQLGYWLRYHTFFNYFSSNDYRTVTLILLLLSGCVAILFNTMYKVRTRGFWKEIRNTALQCGTVFAGIVILLYSVKNSDHISRLVMYFAMILYFVLGLSTRLIYRSILRSHEKRTRKQDVTEEEEGSEPLADIAACEEEEESSQPTTVTTVRAEGKTRSELVTNVTAFAGKQENPQLYVSAAAGIDIDTLPLDISDENTLHIINEDGIIETVPINRNIAYRITKRFFDIVLSIIALILLSPVLLITAIAILLEDGGPVIFKQNRSGFHGQVFGMYKLRSMVKNAQELHQSLLDQNELDGPAFKMKDDPRVTKVGKVIRRTSIDELPQLINIIKGDMSIVGPRPLPVYEMEQCNAYQNQRLLVKPGLTCYWQVMGRNNIGFDDWISLDLKYIQNAGIMTDIGLIIMTFGAVLSGRGAE